MRICTWGYGPRHEGNAPDITGHRWALHVGTWSPVRFYGVHVSAEHEVQRNGVEWDRGVHYFTTAITRAFRLGESHDYCDGPHCGFSVGFLHFSWSYWWCRKCMPDDDCGGSCAASNARTEEG